MKFIQNWMGDYIPDHIGLISELRSTLENALLTIKHEAPSYKETATRWFATVEKAEEFLKEYHEGQKAECGNSDWILIEKHNDGFRQCGSQYSREQAEALVKKFKEIGDTVYAVYVPRGFK